MFLEKFKKILITGFSLLVILSNSSFVFAEDQTRGPQEPVGHQEQVGTTETTGVTETTGPTEKTGTTETTGPTEPTGSKKEEDSTATENKASESDSGSDSEEAINQNTGEQTSQSEPVDEEASSNKTDVKIDNNSNTNNDLELELNSGQNNIEENSVVGSLDTGSIEGTVNVLNMGNSVLADGSSIGTSTIDGSKTNEIVLGTTTNRANLSNNHTGADSANTNLFDSNNFITILTDNDAIADNSIDITADTGDNTISNNTKVGNINTGDITLGVNLINLLNVQNPNLQLSLDVWSILGDYDGDIVLPQLANSNTGANSENSNKVSSNNTINATLNNRADVSNNFEMETSTGGNTLGKNTVLGNLETGNSTVNGSLINLANIDTPMFYIFNIYGKWDGSYMGIDPSKVIINDETGPNSNNQNEADQNNQTNIEVNNNASADNKINIKANTGNNKISNNTTIENIKTGSVKLGANVINILNSFGTDVSKFSLGIVNIFGNWRGNLTNKKKIVADNKTSDSNNSAIINSSSENVSKTIDSTIESTENKHIESRQFENISDNFSDSRLQYNYRFSSESKTAENVSHSTNENKNKDSLQTFGTVKNDSDKGPTSGSKLPLKVVLPIALILLVWIVIEIAARRDYQLKRV